MRLYAGKRLYGLTILCLAAILGSALTGQGVHDQMATQSWEEGGTQVLPANVAVEVEVEEGNIFAIDGEGNRTQLTCYGLDRAPSLSPDGCQVVFVRETPGRQVAFGVIDGEAVSCTASEIWVTKVDGTASRRLVEGWDNGGDYLKPMEPFFDFSSPFFKSGGKKVVFLSYGCVTSRVVYEVDLSGLSCQSLLNGNTLEVIRTGKYKDHLLIQQHRYWLGGGSYDWYWLVAPDGRTLGPVGPDPRGFRKLYMGTE